MLKEMLRENITLADEVVDWKEAIKLAAAPLREQGVIEERYIESMIHNVVENGPYVVIMPKFAIPHSKPENGVNRNGLSLLKLKKCVEFPEGKDVEVLVVLAAKDPDEHLKTISELAELVMDDDFMDRLFSANTREEVLECL